MGLTVSGQYRELRLPELAQPDYYLKHYTTQTFVGTLEINRARRKTVRPSSSSQNSVPGDQFEFSQLVGGPGFEPGASRSRTVIALGSESVA